MKAKLQVIVQSEHSVFTFETTVENAIDATAKMLEAIADLPDEELGNQFEQMREMIRASRRKSEEHDGAGDASTSKAPSDVKS
jgi:hypothetical protein